MARIVYALIASWVMASASFPAHAFKIYSAPGPPKKILVPLPPESFSVSLEEGTAAYLRGDYQTALKNFHPLAAQGDAVAQNAIGFMYSKGRGVPQDDTEAFKWYRKSAEQGYASALANLGSMYYDGRGSPQDYAMAVYWYNKAAKKEQVSGQYARASVLRAQNALGGMYRDGLGVPQNYTIALKWYRKAAEQGHAKAQHGLGGLYYKGYGVPPSYTEALKWYRKAAEQGNTDAQLSLGGMHDRGDGLPQDHIKAHMWTNIAISNFTGSQTEVRIQAVDSLNSLANKMTPAQIAEAQRLAREWKQANTKVPSLPQQSVKKPSPARKLIEIIEIGAAEFLINWPKLVGKPVRVTGGTVTSASENYAQLWLVKDIVTLSGPWVEREDLRYLFRRCKSYVNPRKDLRCNMDVIGVVKNDNGEAELTNVDFLIRFVVPK